MIINTQDWQGKQIRIDYNVIQATPDPETKPELEVNSYETFKYCLEMANGQYEYIPQCRDSRYETALGALSRSRPELYKQYTEQLRQELRQKKHGTKS